MKNVLFQSAALIAAIPSVACADDAVASKDTSDEVIITATRSARDLRYVPVSASVVSRAQIAQTPAKSLDDVLRRVPSIDLPLSASYQLHPTSLGVSMRGLGGTRALVLLDGTPLNDPFFGYVQWNRVPLETIDHVEIVRGGGATLWGNAAMGGVINILTKTPDRTEMTVQGGVGNYGTYRGDVYASLAVSDRIKIGLEGATAHTDGFNTTPTALRGPIDVATGFTAYNAALTGKWSVSSSLTADFRVSYHDNDQTLVTRLANNHQRTWAYTAHVMQDLGDLGSVTVSAFHNDSRFRTDNTGTPAGSQSGQAEFLENRHVTPVHDTGTSLVWRQDFESGWVKSLTLGGDYHGISGRDVANIFAQSGNQIRTDIGSGQQRFLGLFGEAAFKPADPLEVITSVRYQNFKNFDAFDGTPGGLGRTPDHSTSSVDPRVSARWSISKDLAFRGAVYSAFSAPRLDQLYRAFATPSGIFFGNPSLKPETLRGGEFGFDVNHGALRFQATTFTNTIQNLITSAPLNASQLPPGFLFGSRKINAGRARSKGVEAEADLSLTDHWSAMLGFTYADSAIVRSQFDRQSVGKQLEGVPRNRINASLTYEASAGWKITPQARWLSRSWGDNDHTLPVDRQMIFDLAGNYPVTRALEAYAQIENVFDRRYIADNNGDDLPRLGTPLTAMVGLRWRIG